MAWWQWWQREKPKPESVMTPFGEFYRMHAAEDWKASIDLNENSIEIVANDISGAPDPTFIAQLPEILRTLPLLEQAARRNVMHLTDAYYLSGITCCDLETRSANSFILNFGYDEEGWGETVFVYFDDGKVINWGTMD